MKRTFLLCIAAAFSLTAVHAQGKNSWTNVPAGKETAMGEVKKDFESASGNIRFVTLDAERLKQTLATAPARAAGVKGIQVTMPLVGGGIEHFMVLEASNFMPELQAAFPQIRSYVGVGVEDPTAYLRISVSPQNVQSMVLRADKDTEFIEPYTTNNAVYAVFNSGAKRAKGELPFKCTTIDAEGARKVAERAASAVARSDAGTLKTMRLALSCTGEYGVYHGGTVAGALAAMNATMTRVNGVFEKDLAVQLLLIDQEATIIYTNAASDPYSGASDMDNWNDQLQATLTSRIGEAAYDIGHLFGATGGGGNAGCIGCVCEDGEKGSGITSPSNGVPEGDTFDIDYVAHEMGHQMGGNHTFSYSYEGSGAQTEPGSGSSIMGYAGITGSYDVQAHSDDYFTYATINQIQSNLSTKSCPIDVEMGNSDFTIDAGANYSIPRGTPFVLKAVGAEANPATVTYNWEQYDSATQSVQGDNSFALPTKNAGAVFRSVAPSASSTRYFPAFSSVLANTLTTTWESVCNVARTMHFTLTGRDNVATAGLTKTDQVNVIVRSAAGPFAVTSQNTAETSWPVSSEQTVTWDVAGTTASNINTAKVNILLSTDGGATFPITLAANTDNDGSEVISVPAGTESTHCRVLVEAVGNIYYAVNTSEFAIGYRITSECNTYTNSTGANISDGSASYTSQSLTVPAQTETITSISVVVNVTHPNVSDLTINVVSPYNTTVNLWNEQCSTNDNINVTFSDLGSTVVCASPTTGTYKPQGTLGNLLNAATATGIWRLRVRDNVSGNAGNVNSWAVQMCKQVATPLATETYGLQEFAVYPNPSNGSFTVAFTPQTSDEVSVAVHDMRGRLVYNKSFSNTGVFSGNVSLQNAEQGVYLVTVQEGSHKETRKIVVN